MKAFLPLLIIIIVAVAVLMSSPETKNVFNTQKTNTNSNNTQTQNKQTNVDTQEKTQRAQNLAQGLSPFTDYVTIKSLKKPEVFARYEYVTIGIRETNVPINLTGWSIVSRVTGRRATIGNASPFPKNQPEQPLVVSSNQDIIIVSGTSPIGESFRLNACTGYFENKQNFVPDLPEECPRIDIDTLPKSMRNNNICMGYVGSFFACESPTNNPPDNLPNSCHQFVKNTLSYAGCTVLHQNDNDFYKSRWMVYLNSRTALWLDGGEKLDLLDAQGKLVSTFPR